MRFFGRVAVNSPPEPYVKAVSEPINNVSNEGLVRVVHEEGFEFIYVYWTALSMRDRVVRPYPFTASGVKWGVVGLSCAHAWSVVVLTTVVTDV